jgi:hypothetical protein
MTKSKPIDVLVPHGYKPLKNDVDAAWILARHYKTTVQILRPTMGYKEKTPDFQIGRDCYELKTPTSAKTEHIEWTISRAQHQANIVVIDMRKTKIIEKRMIELCQNGVKFHRKIEKIVLIVNKKKVLEIKK